MPLTEQQIQAGKDHAILAWVIASEVATYLNFIPMKRAVPEMPLILLLLRNFLKNHSIYIQRFHFYKNGFALSVATVKQNDAKTSSQNLKAPKENKERVLPGTLPSSFFKPVRWSFNPISQHWKLHFIPTFWLHAFVFDPHLSFADRLGRHCSQYIW